MYPKPVRLSALVAHCYQHVNTDEKGNIEPKYEQKIREKILNMLHTLAEKGHSHIVLGAWGCGAYGNPPFGIARIFRSVLNSEKFGGKFRDVSFAILKNKKALASFREGLR
mmetsp:Transcript_19000/g.33990  ORF Transcript_19000/g.33990 Transcript_19000/m.33990 type:complete len:111 (+) Transcript_19000:416-748(+)